MDLDRFARSFGKHLEAEHAPAPAPDTPGGPQDQPAAATLADDTDELPPWLEARQERAAIMEFDGGLPRDEAEQRAAALHPDPRETRPDWHGLTAAELMEAAGPDWPDICDRPEVLQALAAALAFPPGTPVPKPIRPNPAAPIACGINPQK